MDNWDDDGEPYCVSVRLVATRKSITFYREYLEKTLEERFGL